MNDIRDVSLSPETASLCGITQHELEFYFITYIKKLSQSREDISIEKTLFHLKTMYNGYRFCPKQETPLVYNPYSLLNCFQECAIKYYWFETGTPTLLWQLFQKQNYDVSVLINPVMSEYDLKQPVTATRLGLAPLLYQTGYLTIKSVVPSQKRHNSSDEFEEDDEVNEDVFLLHFPNKEVKNAFYHFLAKQMTPQIGPLQRKSIFRKLKDDLIARDLGQFFSTWQSVLALTPSVLHVSEEKFYHALFHIFAYNSGFPISSEQMTSDGRLDLVIELKT